MINHYLSFKAAPDSRTLKDIEQFFSNAGDFVINTFDCQNLFDQSPLFSQLPSDKDKITLISSSHDVLRMISHAIHLTANKYTVSYIGESSISDSQFSYFKENTKKNTLLINSLSEQIHLLPAKSETPFSLRLGNLRQNISAARNYLADSTFVFFNINALKKADAPAQYGHNPSGLNSEEANQLAYMAGQSHKNKYMVIYGFEDLEYEKDKITLDCILQVLWYYHYGATMKSQPWPVPQDRAQDFTIDSPMSSGSLVFRKDTFTNTWFNKIPFEVSSDQAKHQWIISSHQEYLAAANDDLPLRLLEWYETINPAEDN